ncbi:hypothetical protein POF45_00060 [Pseudomonas sp. 681]|uniref:Uncharacterized protein n=1 Tax=Pseudomonas fungipugnans TaxID=3024217 RepID=A0ABT6QG09_9PSED|nr:hypothetical protein [Pseudomonas sp. 681]MDI2589827.1 hypothetical protein [Pseudomonas sp. 681]
MQHFGKEYFQFFESRPAAERRDYTHQDGVTSVVAVSLSDGKVDEAFAGVYETNGKLRFEQVLDSKALQLLVGDTSIDYMETLARLTELVTEKAGSVVVKN